MEKSHERNGENKTEKREGNSEEEDDEEYSAISRR
jgi:hypothetical protein